MTFHFEEFDFCVVVPGSDWSDDPDGSELPSDSSLLASKILIYKLQSKMIGLTYFEYDISQ